MGFGDGERSLYRQDEYVLEEYEEVDGEDQMRIITIREFLNVETQEALYRGETSIPVQTSQGIRHVPIPFEIRDVDNLEEAVEIAGDEAYAALEEQKREWEQQRSLSEQAAEQAAEQSGQEVDGKGGDNSPVDNIIDMTEYSD